ncbi:MAG: quinone-dependent dihydroorotate dehydrogenase [Pseudomonadota bacterium]|nr:quinone-dependent dihydroorotate dehydrogenase [Pseudomonadota bacterium]
MSLFDRILRPALFRIDPETAHRMSIMALKAGVVPPCPSPADPRLAVSIAGLRFPNPIGLAAGYDKNGEVPNAMARQGFGFVETGSVTPRPQPGNPRPRIFRLEESRGVINRLGFNNDGHAAVLARLAARRSTGTGPVGVNIGANKDSADFAADYLAGLETFHGVADYFTANISSPNTPGLRKLQARAALSDLLDRLLDRRDALTQGSGVQRPVFLKIAPDLDKAQMDDIASAIEGSGLDGLIVSNTTVSRWGIENARHAGESGGLSGRPLFERSTIVLARMRTRLPDLPMIGVGGVESAETAIAKMEAGADLVQLYTAMIYRGPDIAAKINRGLVDALDRDGLSAPHEWRGRRTREWAGRNLPEEN